MILTHSYVEPEIIYGVGDFRGDSYYLSVKAKESRAKVIVFAGVVFMAETAKILSPEATVIVPDRGSGCSLADSITGADVRRLRALYPGRDRGLLHQQHGGGEGGVGRLRHLGNVYGIVAAASRAADHLRARPAHGAKPPGRAQAPGRRKGGHLLRRDLHGARRIHLGAD